MEIVNKSPRVPKQRKVAAKLERTGSSIYVLSAFCPHQTASQTTASTESERAQAQISYSVCHKNDQKRPKN